MLLLRRHALELRRGGLGFRHRWVEDSNLAGSELAGGVWSRHRVQARQQRVVWDDAQPNPTESCKIETLFLQSSALRPGVLSSASSRPSPPAMALYGLCDWLYEQLFADLDVPERPVTPQIECGCCFGEYDNAAMYSCPSNHAFCSACIRSYAEGEVLQNRMDIRCFDGSGCKAVFDTSVLRRSLLPGTCRRLERLWQEREIRQANIPDLVSCPFCHFQMIIEADFKKEPLFRCLNVDDGCGKVSCRECMREDHSPRTCKQERKRSESTRQRVEEAMSGALIRKCPGCKRAIVKEAGCNHIICPDPDCKKHFCYLCRKDITREQYRHFHSNSRILNIRGQCALYDGIALDEQHAMEVEAARERATTDLGVARWKLWRASGDPSFRLPAPLSRLLRRVADRKRD